MNKAQDLTIIVPVHERQWTLVGCLTNLKEFTGPIIIADSSQQPWAGAADFPWVEYRHVPGFDVYTKFRTAIESVKTDLVLLHPDDDFILPSGIKACRAYLRQHPQAAACTGYVIKFNRLVDGVEILYTHVGAHLSFHLQATKNDGESETVAERMDRFFDKLTSINYAVMRREAALQVFTLQDAAPELKQIRFWDKLLLFAVAGYGPVAVLDVLYMMRSSDAVVRKVMTTEMSFEVPATAMAEMVPADGGVLAQYLQRVCGVDAKSATLITRRVVERVARGYDDAAFKEAARITNPMIHAAVFRQAADVQKIFDLIRDLWPVSEKPPPKSA